MSLPLMGQLQPVWIMSLRKWDSSSVEAQFRAARPTFRARGSEGDTPLN